MARIRKYQTQKMLDGQEQREIGHLGVKTVNNIFNLVSSDMIRSEFCSTFSGQRDLP